MIQARVRTKKSLKRVSLIFSRLVIYAIVSVGAAAIILPFIWMLSTSLKLPEHVLSKIPQLIPRRPTIANYLKAFQRASFGRYIVNSTVISFFATIGVLFTSSLGGYVFSKYQFRGKEVLFWGLVGTMMIPMQIYVFPLYLIMRDMHLIDTYLGIMAPSIIMGFGLFLMRQTISTIPNEYLDVAQLDGCKEVRIYWSIILPLIGNSIGALGIFSFISAWGRLLWPLIVTNSNELFTLPLGLATFQKRFTIEYGPMMAGCGITVFPLLIVYSIFRRRIIEGFVLSGIKG